MNVAFGRRMAFLSFVLLYSGGAYAQPMGYSEGHAAGGGAAINSDIPRCPATKGTIAIGGGDADSQQRVSNQTQLDSIVPLLRAAVLESNCFQITTQSNAKVADKIKRFQQEAGGDSFRPNTKNEKNQRIASDFYLDPTVNFASAATTREARQAEASTRNPYAEAATPFLGAIPGFGGALSRSLQTYHNASQQRAPTPQPAAVQTGTAEVTLEIYDIKAGVLIATGTGKGRASSAPGVNAAMRGVNADNPASRAVASAVDDAYRQLVPAIINYQAQHIRGGAGNGGHLPVE